MVADRTAWLALAGFALACLVLAGCGPGPTGDAQSGADGQAPAATSPSGPDLARGELLSFACQACHTLGAGGKHLIGPNLHGIIGRAAATQADFEYSDALRAADLVWTPETIDAWLKDPAGFLPGNNMPFSGYRSADDRRDLIAFLTRATAP
jgi:cytochrome c